MSPAADPGEGVLVGRDIRKAFGKAPERVQALDGVSL